MDVFQPPFTAKCPQPESAPIADPRLQPTPDYGTLGPGSDISANRPQSSPGPVQRPANARRFGPVFSIAIGLLLAVLTSSIGSAHAAWSRFENFLSLHEVSPSSAKDSRQLDRMKPQKSESTRLNSSHMSNS